jgi:uncharacterized membrane protein
MEDYALIGGGIGLLIVGLWIWAIIDIVKSEFKDTIMKIVWLVLVIFLPLLGFFLYVIFGRGTKVRNDNAVVDTKFEELARLKNLYDSGAINESEFETEKRKILGE